MITYELAKKLKEAGFPHPWIAGFHDGKRQVSWYECYIPTLSELIEECGDGFWRMIKAGNSWTVEGGIGTGDLLVYGFSPEEAVANLWLALNEKKI